jgi:calcium binding protein 39
MEKISLNLSNAKFMLYGDAENEPKEIEINKLIEDLFLNNLLLELLLNIKIFEFEARKDVAQIYNYVLRQRKQNSVEYVKQHNEILTFLVDGYTDQEIALNCGSILREVIRHEELNEILLNDIKLFEAFFEYVQLSTFDIASDAFATFKVNNQDIFVRNKYYVDIEYFIYIFFVSFSVCLFS